MKRRDFAAGLVAVGAVAPAFANTDKPNIVTRMFVRMKFKSQTVRLRSLVFVLGQSRGLHYNLNRQFNFRNDNRRAIKGLTAPLFLDEIGVADPVCPVMLFNGDTLIVAPPTQINSNAHSLSLGDDQTTILIGDLKRIKAKETGKIPLLGDLPHIGQLFRSKDDGASKRKLLIHVTANIVNPNEA